ncbi:hypothetical protein BDP27DRAFT_1391537 [Rhodocollybia butyracea]|uniref:Nab2 type CCCH zinc finger 4 domain-containing protein n=1 Tax=Rhodocollybia butyracea TaxID=206335 RepID=A0A9P5UB14_9AGAR|nr:hypothetical protein BDP27DRAFT_1391537 [Rhodocollybia butyracea]
MVFGLTIGTDRALALQQAIQDELMARGYSTDADPVMAEYITIMIINNKTESQITLELEDLIGNEFDRSFTDWLFKEAAKGATETDPPLPELPSAESSERPPDPASSRATSHPINDTSRRTSLPPRNGLYQQAISQALPSSSSSQKRTASARSPSPNHPNKIRRTDVPTGPRAMQQRDGRDGNPRSLLDRVGGPAVGNEDDIQARIDNIVNTGDPNLMMAAGFPGMNGMDMNAMAAGMANPMMIQELMMNQMALMAHFSGMMGPGQFSGFPMQGVMPQDMAVMQQNMNGFQGQAGQNGSSRGRGGVRGGRGVGRGRGGAPSAATSKVEELSAEVSHSPAPTIAAPTPSPATTAPAASDVTSVPALSRPAYAVPERPQSPTLCKYGLKCTNAHCRWSHPSPVATVESGVVLSNDPCENGKDCKDKDCIKAHVSPATLKPQEHSTPPSTTTHSHSHAFPSSSPVQCRFGAACTRPNCSFAHPQRQSNVQCRFGTACTRATCQFQHPPGRVLPTTFHRGLSENGPMVTVKTPEPGSMGGPSPHRSATFNTGAGIKEKLEKQMKEIEEKKSRAEQAVRDAQAAVANGKKDDVKSVEITA